MEKRYQIFISSTFADLEEERKEVMEAIINLDCFPAGMEMFPAADIEQFEYIKSIIDQSDYYILVIAGRYGSLANDGKSYTEKEYEYAKEKGIPILVFVKEDIDNVSISKTDNNPELRKLLLDFRKRVMENRLAKFWNEKMELKYKVHESLSRAFKMNPRTGWIKGNILSSPEIIVELEKLRIENKNLQEKIKQLEINREQETKIKNIAQGNDNIKIKCEYIDYEYTRWQEVLQFTWNELFKFIAPLIGQIKYSDDIKKLMEESLLKGKMKDYEDVEIEQSDFNLIKYQFDELGLIKLEYVKNRECMRVTDSGKKLLKELYIIKKE